VSGILFFFRPLFVYTEIRNFREIFEKRRIFSYFIWSSEERSIRRTNKKPKREKKRFHRITHNVYVGKLPFVHIFIYMIHTTSTQYELRFFIAGGKGFFFLAEGLVRFSFSVALCVYVYTRHGPSSEQKTNSIVFF